MKKFIILTLLVFSGIYASAQSAKPVYDAALAKSLDADERGMKMYVLAILKSGTNKTDNKAILDSLFKGHMANIGRLAANGKLVVAGPFEKNDKNYRGIFIFNVKTIADKLLADFPKAIIIFQHPIWYSPNTYNGAKYLQEGLFRLQSYVPRLDSLVTAYGGPILTMFLWGIKKRLATLKNITLPS